MNRVRWLVLTSAAVLSACRPFPSATDVAFNGQVLSSAGAPVASVKLYYVVYRYRAFSMPGVEEHGYVSTDSAGRYSFHVARAYDAVNISLSGGACQTIEPFELSVPAAEMSSRQNVARDLVCVRLAGR